MKIIDRPSPNFSARIQDPDMIIIHYTDMPTAESALERLCDPKAKVSAHYLIAKTGEIYRLVPENKTAHHAGISHWRGRDSLNQYSIGIEMDNPGHAAGKLVLFPKAQMAALKELIQDIRTRYEIPNYNIIGHSDVAPDRKKDPGELFDWKGLAKDGIGLWPKTNSIWKWALSLADLIFHDFLITWFLPEKDPPPTEIRDIQKLLHTIGYKVPQTGECDEETEFTLLAFQRHFCPKSLGEGPDYKTREILSRAAQMFGV